MWEGILIKRRDKMGISENAAYLKGLADGLELDTTTKEGKVIAKLLDLVSEMAEKVDMLEAANEELYSYIEEIGGDLIDLEDVVYGEDEEYEDYSDLNDDEEFACDEDEDYYEIECPSCGEKICFTDDLEIEELVCPACGESVGDVEVTELCDGDCEGCTGCDE